jgi:hypothetical protein
MGGSKEKSLDDEQRLLAMREYLGVRARPDAPGFAAEIVDAAVGKVQPVIELHSNSTGEVIVEAMAKQLGVRFEEVRSDSDIQRLEKKYLVDKKELGFGLLAQELADRSVDALLFQRMHASGDDPDRWVAVLNMTKTLARAYWSRPHELIHRLAEPPQKRLPFYRHKTDAQNRLERIIDLGAADLAFPAAAFGRRVEMVTQRNLDWTLVNTLRSEFAPTSSLLSAAKAVLRFWPHPAFLLSATVRGRRSRPHVDVALRIDLEGYSPGPTGSGVQFFPNMRVPLSSPTYHTHQTGREIGDIENLGAWTTSGGDSLPNRRALTCGVQLGQVTYALVSLL